MKPLPRLNLPWKRAKKKRRGVFLPLLLVVALILGYQFIWVPVFESQNRVREELQLTTRMLSRYEESIKSRKEIDEELNQTVQKAEAIQARLLTGETPQINAANLQEILRKLSEKNGIQIRSFRMGEPKETTFYLKIPVVIDIMPTKSMASVAYFLYDIENHEKVLMVSDIDLTAPNMRNPSEVQGSLTVAGLAQNAQRKGKGKEG